MTYLLNNLQLFGGIDTSEVFQEEPDDTSIVDDIEVATDESEPGEKEVEKPIEAPAEKEPVEPEQSHKTNDAFKKLRVENEQLKKQQEAYNKTQNDSKQKQNEDERVTKEQELRDAGYDPQMIKQALQMDPEYQQMLSENNDLKLSIQKQASDQIMVNNFNKLKAEYPDMVKSPDDIPDEVWAKEAKGYDLADAFYIVNREKISEREKDSAKQSIKNTYDSKSHIKSESSSSDDSVNDVSIDTETLRNYMDMGLSKKEAMRFHKKLYG